MGYAVGEVVFVTKIGHHCYGKCGTVKHLAEKGSENVGVEFDETIPGCHNLNNLLTVNRGYYMSPKELVKMKPVGQAMKDYYDREALKRKKPAHRSIEPVIILEGTLT